MAINSIGFLNSYSCSGNALISEETRRKLIALGIDPSLATSEAQAKVLIEKARKTSKTEQPQTSKNTETAKSNANTSERELISKAKILGEKMGLSFSEDATLEEMLTTIASKISGVINSDGNNTEKSKYMEYNAELNTIKEGYSVTKQNENAVLMSMNYNSDINKILLGLQ